MAGAVRRRAQEKGVEEAKAHELYDKLVAFSGFGFPKSHAAAFGLLAYQSAWLRHHYAPEFLAALLNAQPMGFYRRRRSCATGRSAEWRRARPT